MIGLAVAGTLLAVRPAAAAEADAASARAFVEKLYSAYHGDNGPDYLGRKAPQVFAPALLALIRRDVKLTPKGDVGALDGDPICDCQDSDIGQVEVTLGPIRAGRVAAEARFLNFKDRQTVGLDLVAMKAGWRIENIHSADILDLAEFLRLHAGGR